MLLYAFYYETSIKTLSSLNTHTRVLQLFTVKEKMYIKSKDLNKYFH